MSWTSPNIITGKFTYMLYLYGPTGCDHAQTHFTVFSGRNAHNCFTFCSGYLYENSTGDMRFAFTGLTPYTKYTVAVRAKAAGEVGPPALEDVATPAEGENTPEHFESVRTDI